MWPKLVPLVLCIAALVLPGVTVAQQMAGLRVVTREDGTGRAVPGVQVIVGGFGTVSVTDSTGTAHALSVPFGQRLVQVRRVGFQTESFSVQFRPGETVEAEIDLLRAPIELEGLTVSERMPSRSLRKAGFYERRSSGSGQFLDREQIEARRPDKLSSLFRGIPGLNVHYCPKPKCDEPGYILVSSLAERQSLTQRCRMMIYLDGALATIENVDNLNVNALEGVEVYHHTAGLPAQFNATGASCGVVLLWTRAER